MSDTKQFHSNHKMMKTAKEARTLGQQVADFVQAQQLERAYACLTPILAKKVPFRLLDQTGRMIGAVPLAMTKPLLDRIVADQTIGGWAVVGSTLQQQLSHDLVQTLALTRTYIIAGDVWYSCDILGERVPGPALVNDFQAALDILDIWRGDSNRWVRRAVGVSVHLWAKRTRGASEHHTQAKALLDFLTPVFEERQTDAVKGIGWGLKTLGKYYPNLTSDWLVTRLGQTQPRALILRKALTYLPPEQRAQVAAVRPA